MFEGYNVIQLVIEASPATPLTRANPHPLQAGLMSFVFNNYYTALHYTSTSNGECQTLLGLYPKNGNPITMKRTGVLGTNAYFSLAQQLGREGYQVLGYHGNYDMYGRQASHTNLGYTWKQFGTGLEVDTNASGEIAWPARDTQVIENSVDDYINSDQPSTSITSPSADTCPTRITALSSPIWMRSAPSPTPRLPRTIWPPSWR